MPSEAVYSEAGVTFVRWTSGSARARERPDDRHHHHRPQQRPASRRIERSGGTCMTAGSFLSGSPGTRDWYANLLVKPEFTFHLKGSAQADLPAIAHPVTDETERRKVMPSILDDLDGAPGDLEELSPGSPLVEVEFLDHGRAPRDKRLRYRPGRELSRFGEGGGCGRWCSACAAVACPGRRGAAARNPEPAVHPDHRGRRPRPRQRPRAPGPTDHGSRHRPRPAPVPAETTLLGLLRVRRPRADCARRNSGELPSPGSPGRPSGAPRSGAAASPFLLRGARWARVAGPDGDCGADSCRGRDQRVSATTKRMRPPRRRSPV